MFDIKTGKTSKITSGKSIHVADNALWISTTSLMFRYSFDGREESKKELMHCLTEMCNTGKDTWQGSFIVENATDEKDYLLCISEGGPSYPPQGKHSSSVLIYFNQKHLKNLISFLEIELYKN